MWVGLRVNSPNNPSIPYRLLGCKAHFIAGCRVAGRELERDAVTCRRRIQRGMEPAADSEHGGCDPRVVMEHHGVSDPSEYSTPIAQTSMLATIYVNLGSVAKMG
jgi:hypothetical protein